MPPEYAVAPTGNAWISENLPGFNVMRASYRWAALGVFGLWLLVMIWVARTDGENRRMWIVGLAALILRSLPDFQGKWKGGREARDMFGQIGLDLVAELRQHMQPGETVAFVPWGNDFLADYLAPKWAFNVQYWWR